ncbi:MAG: hypothetical protein FJX59_18410 [Alphaproteobacteria bacterium]|nr:hypothetical protein [Alphaproteobacteria bacterium]
MSVILRWTLISLVGVALGACAPLGPAVLRANRAQFNEAVQQTEAQQLLLNIVRQRYTDPVMLLDVTGISSGTSRQFYANILNKILPSGRDEFQNGVGATFGETPVIFYAPNTGGKFVRQMLLPLDLRAVTIVLQGGWSIERVLLLTGESLSDMRNEVGAATESKGDFSITAGAMRELQRRPALTIGVEARASGGGGKDAVQSVVLSISAKAKESEAYRTLCERLAVTCDGQPIKLQLAIGAGRDAGSATLATRSLLSSMFFLAQGVDVPEGDVAAGVVEASRGLDISRGELFHVRSSREEPSNAAVKVLYRDT